MGPEKGLKITGYEGQNQLPDWSCLVSHAAGADLGEDARMEAMYDPQLVTPMRHEMVEMGATELTNEQEVQDFLAKQDGTALLFVNSVCGCAAGSARPGLKVALGNDNKPDRVGTVFAGQHAEATAKARSFFSQFPPSSPSAVLFKDGEPVFYLPRHMIEGRDPPSVAYELVTAFDQFCK